ncbi:hypothetical protein KCH_73070 [Kitasatospora cheerisanensis KCTC 2395]|uniref:Uncharacterized protein n=1 Tax=Kitasatospora cheerisanensis KCTC 2395 TaxID=1348663 RepID=A0A066YLZ2_9ACTN|nr:hypothetical protein KCH_73070 [Kitasatospora cheerisanensis KCTC 2395]
MPTGPSTANASTATASTTRLIAPLPLTRCLSLGGCSPIGIPGPALQPAHPSAPLDASQRPLPALTPDR